MCNILTSLFSLVFAHVACNLSKSTFCKWDSKQILSLFLNFTYYKNVEVTIWPNRQVYPFRINQTTCIRSLKWFGIDPNYTSIFIKHHVNRYNNYCSAHWLECGKIINIRPLNVIPLRLCEMYAFVKGGNRKNP